MANEDTAPPPPRPDSVARGSALLLSAQLVGNAGFFVAVLLIARGLGPAGRGTIAFITVTALVLGRATKVGVTEATTVFAAQRPPARAVLLTNLLLFAAAGSLLGAAVVAGTLLAVGATPAGVGRAELLILVLGAVANGLVVGGNAFLLGCKRFRARALVTAVAPWLYAVLVAVVLSGPGLTVTRAALVWLAAESIWAILALSTSARGIGLARPSFALLWESVGFGIRAWLGGLATFANARADQILMGFIASEATLGIYAVAVNGAEVLLYVPQAAATALLPIVASKERAKGADQALRVFRAVVLVTALGGAIAAALGPLAIPAVFGADFSRSVDPFLLLLPGALGFAASIIFSYALVASASPGLSSLGPFVSLVAGLALDVVLIPRFGAEGAAAAASAAFLAGGATALVAFRSRTPFPWRTLVPGRRDIDALRAVARPPRRAPSLDRSAS